MLFAWLGYFNFLLFAQLNNTSFDVSFLFWFGFTFFALAQVCFHFRRLFYLLVHWIYILAKASRNNVYCFYLFFFFVAVPNIKGSIFSIIFIIVLLVTTTNERIKKKFNATSRMNKKIRKNKNIWTNQTIVMFRRRMTIHMLVNPFFLFFSTAASLRQVAFANRKWLGAEFFFRFK